MDSFSKIIDKYFEISKRGSDLATEIKGVHIRNIVDIHRHCFNPCKKDFT